MIAAWGADPLPFVLPAAKEAHLALQQERATQRILAEIKNAPLPGIKPDFTLAGMLRLERKQPPFAPYASNAGANNNPFVSSSRTTFPTPPRPPAVWGGGGLNYETLGLKPKPRSASTQTFTPQWPSENLNGRGQKPFNTAIDGIGGFSLIPDPVFIVKQNKWPRGFEHWGLAQRIGYLDALVGWWADRFPTVKLELSIAHGLLYEQYAVGPNKPL